MKKLLSLMLTLIMIICSSFCFDTIAFADDYTVVNISIQSGEDAATVIQDTIKNYKGNGSYKFVVAPGTYNLNSRIAVFSNTWLELTGVTFNRTFSGSVMLTIGHNSDGATGSDFYRNIVVNGGTFNSNGQNGNSGSIFTFSHASNVTVTNVTFKNCCSGHHLTFAGCNNVNVKYCRFEGQYYNSDDNDANMEAIQLDILEKSHFPGLQPQGYDATMNSNITVSDCVFENVNRGVGSHSIFAGKYMSDISIVNNTFKNVGGYAIQTSNYINTSIIGNIISDCGAGIYYRSSIPNYSNVYAYGNSAPVRENYAEIANNYINVVFTNDKTFNQLSYGIRVYGENIKTNQSCINAGDYRAYNVNIHDNTINLNTNANGIWLVGAVGTKAANNTINYASGTLRSSEPCFGIRYESSQSVNIDKNVINANSVSCVQNGIISDKSTGAVLTSNTVSKAKKNGINISTKSSASLNKNTIKNNGENGIFCYDSSTIKTSSNTVSGNKKHGVFIVNSPSLSTLSGDKISSSKQYGVAIQKSKAKLTSLSVKSNKQYGIYLTQSSNATISKCTVSKNARDGIYITQTSTANISGGTVDSNSGNGIYFTNKAKGSIKKVSVKKNKKAGIYFTKKVGKITVNSVSYSANKGGKIKK